MRNLIKRILCILPDELYIQLRYFYHFHRFANLKNPQTFNEKLQWLKLHNRKPLYTTLVDKYVVKKWIADKIGKQYIIPTLGVWEKAEDIEFDKLPNQFVLKCNHSGGGNVVICKDKAKLDRGAVIKKLSHQLKNNNYWYGREWPYKNVPPRIIAEEFMLDRKTQELRDYKFLCFDGEPRMLYIASERQNPEEETKFDFYDMDFNHLPFTNGHQTSNKHIDKPSSFNEMVRLATILSKGLPHVRVDFYEVNDKVYFGELTFYHTSGFAPFKPSQWDKKIGDWLQLPKEK